MIGNKNSVGLLIILIFVSVLVYSGISFTSSASGYGLGKASNIAIRGNVTESTNNMFSFASIAPFLFGFGFLIVVIIAFGGFK